MSHLSNGSSICAQTKRSQLMSTDLDGMLLDVVVKYEAELLAVSYSHPVMSKVPVAPKQKRVIAALGYIQEEVRRQHSAIVDGWEAFAAWCDSGCPSEGTCHLC